MGEVEKGQCMVIGLVTGVERCYVHRYNASWSLFACNDVIANCRVVY